jgi:hypothetical protein
VKDMGLTVRDAQDATGVSDSEAHVLHEDDGGAYSGFGQGGFRLCSPQVPDGPC